MLLSDVLKFQKALALSASASNPFEAEAAELAARRLMVSRNLDPTRIPDQSFLDRNNFANNSLLQKLRAEWLELHPPLPRKVEEERSAKPSSTPTIKFNINGYTKHRNKQRKQSTRRPSGPRDEDRVERLRQLLNSGKSRPLICKEDGYTQGQISGIIRDCTGGKGANPLYDGQKWTVCWINGKKRYEREQDHPPGNGPVSWPMGAAED